MKIDDLDVDRYDIDGVREQVLITARELDLGNIPNKSWQGEHLVSTRGCGLVLAPVGRVTDRDRPDYQTVDLDRPELYFSPAISGYAIARTDVDRESVRRDRAVRGHLRRRAEGRSSARPRSRSPSSTTTCSARVRSTATRRCCGCGRCRTGSPKLAPFLDYDGDPYPVVVDGGVQWVIDAYTSTSRYPYAQRIGNVQLSYVDRPVAQRQLHPQQREGGRRCLHRRRHVLRRRRRPIRSCRRGSSAFPDLFTDVDDMPDELREHLRYPEDLFRVQTDLYSKYQIAPADFFQRTGAWSVAQAPSVDRQDTTRVVSGATDPTDVQTEFATETNVERFVPYYTMFSDAATGNEEFVILRPFVPFSTDDRRTELQAYMTASSDPDNYGELVAYVVEQDPLPPGPLRVADQAESEQDISPELSLQANQETGTNVKFGDLQLIPVADGLIYIRPVYVVASDVTEYRFVIVSSDNQAVLDTSLDAALARLFLGFEGDIGDRIADEDDQFEPPTTEDPPSSGTNDPAALAAEAERLYVEAQQLLRDGDLGGYQAKLDEVGQLLAQLSDELGN